MKCLLSPLFLLAQDTGAEFVHTTGVAGEMCSDLWHCCGHG